MNTLPSTIAPLLALRRNGAAPVPIAPEKRQIVKRDGSRVAFDVNRIVRAVALAFYEVRNGTQKNPYRNDATLAFGLDDADYKTSVEIAAQTERMLEAFYRKGDMPTVEKVQDTVQMAIATAGAFDVLTAYANYRAQQAQHRLKDYPNNGGIRDYIFVSKYARYNERTGRRETFAEAVERVRGMHHEFYAEKLMREADVAGNAKAAALAGANVSLLNEMLGGRTVYDILNDALDAVGRTEVLPSMRSLQFGGKPTLAKHARIFNCSFTNIDRLEAFREYFWLLLCGCGVGFSVQKHHVAMLPPLPVRLDENELKPWFFRVEDTIEGWADALDALLRSFYENKQIEFEFSAIRPEGSPLKLAGGKAPGYRGLKKALTKIEKILQGASGRNLRPIEVYDILMHTSQAVLSGGIRRSATIALFSADDEEMMNAKTGDWFETHKHRTASNNSAVISRHESNKELFYKLFEAQKQFGEPGFYFCDDPDAGTNPCAEISLNPVLRGDALSAEDVEKLYRYGYKGDLPATTRLSGFQHCNLTTINAGKITDVSSFYRAIVHATVIGTLQAGYTQMDYLSPVTRVINEKDALLGVSICGIMDNPEVLLDPEVLSQGARLARAANRVFAAAIGIRHAARVTTVKPEGTASLFLGTASGIHPHHAPEYFRRVTANRLEAPYVHFKAINPQMCEPSVTNDRDDKITFPYKAPKNALFRSDVHGVRFLEIVRLVQQTWVVNGNDEESRDPHLNHNVSNTCTFNLEDAKAVADFIWDNRAGFTGIALLKAEGDKTYKQAPNEAITTERDIAIWNSLDPKPVDFTQLLEATDTTSLREVVACAGGACSLV